jgi:hypothetical protein
MNQNLAKLAELRASGAITDDQYQRLAQATANVASHALDDESTAVARYGRCSLEPVLSLRPRRTLEVHAWTNRQHPTCRSSLI